MRLVYLLIKFSTVQTCMYGNASELLTSLKVLTAFSMKNGKSLMLSTPADFQLEAKRLKLIFSVEFRQKHANIIDT